MQLKKLIVQQLYCNIINSFLSSATYEIANHCCWLLISMALWQMYSQMLMVNWK